MNISKISIIGNNNFYALGIKVILQRKKKQNETKTLIHLIEREKREKKPVEHLANDWGS